jgi:hypothetical protein
MIVSYKKGMGNFAELTKNKVEEILRTYIKESITLDGFVARVKTRFSVSDSYINDYYGYMYLTYNCILFAVEFDYLFNVDIY